MLSKKQIKKLMKGVARAESLGNYNSAHHQMLAQHKKEKRANLAGSKSTRNAISDKET